jgi:hypothetical protein
MIINSYKKIIIKIYSDKPQANIVIGYLIFGNGFNRIEWFICHDLGE